MHLLQKIAYFLSFYRRALTIYDVHSPFLSAILLPLFYGKQPKPGTIEQRRKSLCQDKRQITKTEYGAGSSLHKGKRLFVHKMAANSPVSNKEGSWLALLADKQNVKTILELGTHFGLSGAYLISLNKNARLFTIEGCPETAAIATETFLLLPPERLFTKTFSKSLRSISWITFSINLSRIFDLIPFKVA